jgi:hypothetical protein
MQNAITTRSGVSAWVDDLGRPAVEGALQRACRSTSELTGIGVPLIDTGSA